MYRVSIQYLNTIGPVIPGVAPPPAPQSEISCYWQTPETSLSSFYHCNYYHYHHLIIILITWHWYFPASPLPTPAMLRVTRSEMGVREWRLENRWSEMKVSLGMACSYYTVYYQACHLSTVRMCLSRSRSQDTVLLLRLCTSHCR